MKILCKNSCVFENKHFSFHFFIFIFHYLVFLVADSVHQSCLVDYLDWVVVTELAGLRFAGGGQVNEGIAAGSGVQQPVVNIGPGKASKYTGKSPS